MALGCEGLMLAGHPGNRNHRVKRRTSVYYVRIRFDMVMSIRVCSFRICRPPFSTPTLRSALGAVRRVQLPAIPWRRVGWTLQDLQRTLFTFYFLTVDFTNATNTTPRVGTSTVGLKNERNVALLCQPMRTAIDYQQLTSSHHDSAAQCV